MRLRRQAWREARRMRRPQHPARHQPRLRPGTPKSAAERALMTRRQYKGRPVRPARHQRQRPAPRRRQACQRYRRHRRREQTCRFRLRRFRQRASSQRSRPSTRVAGTLWAAGWASYGRIARSRSTGAQALTMELRPDSIAVLTATAIAHPLVRPAKRRQQRWDRQTDRGAERAAARRGSVIRGR